MKKIGTLSVIIAVYNEEKTICLIIDKVCAVELINGMKKEIIIVNDCSTDNTAGVIEDYRAMHAGIDMTHIDQPVNRGKGAAIRKGIEAAQGEYVIIQDADLEYDPADYNRLLRPMLNLNADAIYGSRFVGGNPHRILFFWHTIGNRLLTFVSNLFTNLNLTDMETCYKLFRADVIKNIPLCENRFGFEPEVTAKLARIKNLHLYEVGISYYGRTYLEGKKIVWKDGVRAFYCIIKYNIFKRK